LSGSPERHLKIMKRDSFGIGLLIQRMLAVFLCGGFFRLFHPGFSAKFTGAHFVRVTTVLSTFGTHRAPFFLEREG
jgi:hypothetical protein